MRNALVLVNCDGKHTGADAESKTLHDVLDSLPGNCALLDSSGRILFANLSWRKFATANGLRDQNYCMGQNYLETCRRAALKEPQAKLALEGIISVLHGQREEFQLEYPCHSPTEKRWYRMSVSRLHGDAALLVMHTNITERMLAAIEAEERCKELKAMIQRRKEYETRLADFYSTVAHDIRSPLTSVLGSISLLNGLAPAQLSADEAKSLLESAEFASRQILALVTDFLDQRKIEQGKMEFAVAEVRAASLLQDARKMVDGLARISGVDVAIDFEDELVVCNADSIIRVLTNLLSNAIKFTPSGKRVYLTARRADDHHVQFMVRDEGRGMSSEVQERLFEPFGPSEASDVMAGSGLGLMVVKSMLEQHGSTPMVQSEVGTGTAISFELRRA